VGIQDGGATHDFPLLPYSSEYSGTALQDSIAFVVPTHFYLYPQRCTMVNKTYHSFATRVSQLKICAFSGQTFNGFEVL
jgi:hypothetical protein